MSPLHYVPTNPGQMDWDIVSIEGDPMSITDTSDDESNTSDEGSVGDDAAENDLASVSSEDPVEDDDLHEIQAQLEGKHRWSSSSDLVEDPSMEGDLGDGDNESVKDQAEMQDILDEQNSYSSSSSNSESTNQRNPGRLIFGLDQQKTTSQKISDWFDKTK